jgi:hypothetical protein
LDSTWTIYSPDLEIFFGGGQLVGSQLEQKEDLNIRLSLNIIITGFGFKK